MDDLRAVSDRDLVTLVTCTPYGINSHRLLVRGTRVPVDEESVDALFTEQIVVWQWWMTAVLAVAALVLCGFTGRWRGIDGISGFMNLPQHFSEAKQAEGAPDGE